MSEDANKLINYLRGVTLNADQIEQQQSNKSKQINLWLKLAQTINQLDDEDSRKEELGNLAAKIKRRKEHIKKLEQETL